MPIQIFCIKVLVSLHHSKLLGIEAIQSLYRYFPQVILHRYRFNRHFFFLSRPPLVRGAGLGVGRGGFVGWMLERVSVDWGGCLRWVGVEMGWVCGLSQLQGQLLLAL